MMKQQMCVNRPRMEECLPRDALEAIMGFLDLETLCTARLVSKTFCAAASAHVCSLAFASTTKAVSFHRFPHLRHVHVRHSPSHFLDAGEDNFLQLDPCLWDAATALTVRVSSSWTSIPQIRDFLSKAAQMPKLRGLIVDGAVEHEAALLARCTNLEAIRFTRCNTSVARTIVTLTQLIFLDIRGVCEDGDQGVSADVSWLEPVTNFRSLKNLRICTVDGALPLIGNLTGLTQLELFIHSEVTYSIAPLTRLTRLRCLSIGWGMTEGNLAVACSLGLGSLVNLRLWSCEEASADCGRFLSRQTALRRLALHGRQLCNLRHIGGVRIELLLCLDLHDIGALDAEGLSVLRRATSLTRLTIAGGITQPQMGLSQVLSRLIHLRSLMLARRHRRADTNILDLSRALSPLTALTSLHLHSHRLDEEGLGALSVLTGLRELELIDCRLTDDMLPELGVLTTLRSLSIWDSGITSLAPVSEVLDPLRYARGLPPLRTKVGWW